MIAKMPDVASNVPTGERNEESDLYDQFQE